MTALYYLQALDALHQAQMTVAGIAHHANGDSPVLASANQAGLYLGLLRHNLKLRHDEARHAEGKVNLL